MHTLTLVIGFDGIGDTSVIPRNKIILAKNWLRNNTRKAPYFPKKYHSGVLCRIIRGYSGCFMPEGAVIAAAQELDYTIHPYGRSARIGIDLANNYRFK